MENRGISVGNHKEISLSTFGTTLRGTPACIAGSNNERNSRGIPSVTTQSCENLPSGLLEEIPVKISVVKML